MTWTMVLPVLQMWYPMFSVMMQKDRGQWKEKLLYGQSRATRRQSSHFMC